MRASTWAVLLLWLGALGARAGAQPAEAPPPPVSLRLSSGVLEEGGEVAVDVLLAPAPQRDLSAYFSLTEAEHQHNIWQSPFVRWVSPRVVIRAGQNQARAVLRAPDDSLHYGQKRFGISVYVSGLSGPGEAFTTLEFRDNDARKISLQANGSVWREGTPAKDLLAFSSNTRAGFAVAEITSSRPDVIEAPAYRGGPLRVLEKPGADAPTPVTLTVSGPGLEPADVTVTVVDASSPVLSVSFWPPWIDEDATSPARGFVTRSGDLSKPLRVALGSSNRRLVGVPESVTIEADKALAAFEATPIEGREVDYGGPLPSPLNGPRDAIIWADAEGLASGRCALHVRDTTPVIEALATPFVCAEEDAPVRGSVSVRLLRPRAHDVEVTLSAKDKRIALASTSAVLPRGGQAVLVPFEVVDDDREGSYGLSEIEVRDGFIRAFDGLPSPAAKALVRLLDNDAELSLRLSRANVLAHEGRWTLDATVTRREPGPAPLEVKLSSKVYAEPGKIAIELPSSITIPAGQGSATARLSATSSQDASANVQLDAQTDKARASAGFSVLGPQNIAHIVHGQEVLSRAEPERVVILDRGGAVDFPSKIFIRPEDNAGLVEAPAEIQLQANQKLVAIPMRLIGDPETDTTVSFKLWAPGQAPDAGTILRVAVLATPETER